ncbi:DUF1572 family protein [Paenibacillus popilliae]|uniref:DUF1572 domain-containing protein n=1 Tax=Paenibacillus popilliae TaxID=78057 RepID=A0ABY3ANI6_PAEPP|nr:DUF1572 family protein [Paenibacillus sp. SDF0028]TQR44369.1 DUF1572 domain-containing protein [Paenibacillus sp. SDF0028]
MVLQAESQIAQHYLHVVNERFLELKKMGERTFEQLEDEEWNWSYNVDSNSIAVIVKHMSGNMISRWTDFLTTDGEKDDRNRDGEFEDSITSREMLLDVWNQGWKVFLDTLQSLTVDDLTKTVTIRQQPHTVMEAIERQMSHYAYHVGQIVYAAKQLKSEEWSTLSIPRKKN